MRILSIFCVLFLSACSTNVIDMTATPTEQKYDLTDAEGDGIISARDECPESYAGAQVDNNGCGSKIIETIRRKLEVNFATDSSIVQLKYLPEISKLAAFMKEHPQTTVTIEGHTSIRGSAKHNKILSLHRAQAIKYILSHKYNIAVERINAVGYGSENLLLEGDDEYIHSRNRRVVAEISSEKILPDMKWTIYSVDEIE